MVGEGPWERAYVSPNTPEDRCGLTFEYGDYSWLPTNVTCWREAWDNYDNCLWHADVQGKPRDELDQERTDEPERLDGAVIRGAELGDWVTFTDCTLSGADLSDANLEKANFIDASLREADLREADLEGANLGWADLEEADLEGAELTDADLEEANLVGANLKKADLANRVLRDFDFDRANLEHADLSESDLREATFEGARLHETFLEDARFNGETDLQKVYAYDVPGLQPADFNTRSDRFWMNVKLALHYLTPAWLYNSDLDPDPNKAVRVHRKLQLLLRENALPGEVPHHYVRERHARRREAMVEDEFTKWISAALQRWVMGYGEKPGRVVGTSVAIILLFGVFYSMLGGIHMTPENAEPLAFDWFAIRSFQTPEWLEILLGNLYFSAVTFSTLGYGDVEPASGAVQFLASVQSITGAALLALLVAVLARRITR